MARELKTEVAPGLFKTWWFSDVGDRVINITHFFSRGKEYELWIRGLPSGICFKSLKDATQAMEAWVSVNVGAK